MCKRIFPKWVELSEFKRKKIFFLGNYFINEKAPRDTNARVLPVLNDILQLKFENTMHLGQLSLFFFFPSRNFFLKKDYFFLFK